jgi:O-antigen/teichoic acid export membrane protein
VVIALLVACALAGGVNIIKAAAQLLTAEAPAQTKTWLPREDVPLAFAFWITMLSLVAVTYLDQILLAALAPRAGELKSYSMAVLFIVTPFALFATALGTILVPVIAGGDTIKQHLNRWGRSRRTVTFCAIFSVVGAAIYFELLSVLLQKVGVSLSPGLYVILVVTGIVRLAYAVPSSVVGALGSRRRVGVLAKAGIGAILLQVIFVYLFYHTWGIAGVAAATCLVWIYRLLIGMKLISGLSY